MGGLHFYCGKWLGDDKSANPIFELIDELQEYVQTDEREVWINNFLTPWNAQMDTEVIEISLVMLDTLHSSLRRYQTVLISRLHLSGPDATILELGGFPRSISEDEAKFECIADIFRGHEVSKATGHPLAVHYC